MSVQAGIWKFDGEPVRPEELRTMVHAHAQHFDVPETIHLDSNVGFLYGAVHTTPESHLEQQPHLFGDGKVLTWDGRLDNREDLIGELHDRVDQSTPDAEIVAACFERWHSECFARLRGDWAAAIWDARNSELILARDYIGVRQLFYRQTPQKLIWCSKLSVLTSPDSTFDVCEQYIANYLVLRLDGHLTPYSAIYSVPPGSFLRIHNERITTCQYWTFRPRSSTRYKTDSAYEEHFLHLFRQAVTCRLRANSRVFADLSGGLDSSSIVCMADRILVDASLETISHNFRDEPGGDDDCYIKAIEQKRGQIGHHLDIWNKGESFSLQYNELLPSPILRARSEVEKARAALIKTTGCRICLSGFGGDEFLGQALEARVAMADAAAQLKLTTFVRELIAWSLFWREPIYPTLLKTLELLFPPVLRRQVIGAISTPAEWLDPDFASRYRLLNVSLTASEGSWWWLPSARDWFQTRARISGILTNLHSNVEEMRYPYLDQRLTEFMASIPIEQMLRPGDRRSLMRRALRGLVPSEVLLRRSKQQESRGYALTLRKHWQRVQELLKSPLVAELGYVRAREFRNAFTALRDGFLYRESMMLLRGLFLEVWLRSAVEHNVFWTQGQRRKNLHGGEVEVSFSASRST